MSKKSRQPKRRKLHVVVPPTDMTPEELTLAILQTPPSPSGSRVQQASSAIAAPSPDSISS